MRLMVCILNLLRWPAIRIFTNVSLTYHFATARSVAEKASGSLDIRNVANHFLDETEVSNIFFGDESHFCSYRFGSDDDLQGLLTVPVKVGLFFLTKEVEAMTGLC